MLADKLRAAALQSAAVLEFKSSAYVEHSRTAAKQITLPSDIVSGDLILLFVCDDRGNLHTPPSGWTEIYDYGNDVAAYVAYKVASGSDASSTVTYYSGPNTDACAVVAVFTSAVVSVLGTDANNGSTPITAPSLTANDNEVLIAVVAQNNNGLTLTTSTSGFTTISAETSIENAALGVYYREVSAGATGTFVCDESAGAGSAWATQFTIAAN